MVWSVLVFMAPHCARTAVPAFFFSDPTRSTSSTDVTDVMGLNVFVKLFPKLLYSLSVRHRGEGLSFTATIRVIGKTTKSGSVFSQCLSKQGNSILVI